jgi:hypothetical protein
VFPNGCGIEVAQNFGGFFHQIKQGLRIGKKELYKSRLPKNEEIRRIFVYSSIEL